MIGYNVEIVIFLFSNAGFLFGPIWMYRSAVMIGSWQVLRGSRSPTICGGVY
jgi:hypothetical protein